MVGFNRKITINPPIPFEPNFTYTYDIEPLKLEVGKFYRLRNGKKAIVANVDKQDISGHPAFVAVIGGGNNSYWVSETGKYSIFASEWDLVAPWEE